MSRPVRIMLCAGEASGDRLGAGLAQALTRLRPDVELLGMGGPEMQAAGVRLVQRAEEVSVVGIVEVLRHLPAIRRAMARLRASIESERPDLLVPIDFPDFNLRLARHANSAGVGVVYYVSPQIWAWRRGRVVTMRDRIRRVLVLFPFEIGYYAEGGVPVTFVGHPVVDRFEDLPPRERILQTLELDSTRPVVALMPGSRVGEVQRNLPPLGGAATLLAGRHPEPQFLVPRASTLDERWFTQRVRELAPPGTRVVAGHYPELLTACDAGAVSSGTGSLEAALAGLPTAVVYRVRPLTHLLGKLLLRVDHVAMPNLIAGKEVVPELLQRDCTPDRIAAVLSRYLDDPSSAAHVRAELADVRRKLGPGGATRRAAEAVLRELKH